MSEVIYTEEDLKRQARKDAERAAYWANKGKKAPRLETRLVCGACRSSHGTFEWRETPTTGRQMVHINCPGPRPAPAPKKTLDERLRGALDTVRKEADAKKTAEKADETLLRALAKKMGLEFQ